MGGRKREREGVILIYSFFLFIFYYLKTSKFFYDFIHNDTYWCFSFACIGSISFLKKGAMLCLRHVLKDAYFLCKDMYCILKFKLYII